jgi:ABC-type nitrate/sulfonate/bicarbonate transport system permease component
MTALLKMRFAAPLFGLASLLLALVLLEGLILAGAINRFIIPLPSEVAAAFPRMIFEEDVLHRFLQTAREAAWASALLILVGIPLGALLFRFAVLRLAWESWVAALASAPIVLMYPLFLVIFGRSETTLIIMGFIAGLPPLVLKTLEGLAGTRRVFIDVARSFKLSEPQLFRKILFPSALPTVFVGLRLALIFALINIVAVEFLINFGGLGQLVNDLAERYDLAATYAAICFVVLVSVLFFAATERVERWLRPGP